MGRWPNPGNSWRKFNGALDVVSVWAQALTGAEINSIMTTPESVTGVSYDTPYLLSYWNFDGFSADDLPAIVRLRTSSFLFVFLRHEENCSNTRHNVFGRICVSAVP